MGPTIATKSKRAHNPHTMHRVRDCKVAFTFQSIGRRNITNPALVPAAGQINERYMPLSGPGRRRVQFKSVRFLKRWSDLKPFHASPNQKLANRPQGQAKILDVGPQRSILWVIFHTSLCPLVRQVIAYYTKFPLSHCAKIVVLWCCVVIPFTRKRTWSAERCSLQGQAPKTDRVENGPPSGPRRRASRS